jgi:hypothetical protein
VRSMLRICGSVGDSGRPQSQTQSHSRLVQLTSELPLPPRRMRQVIGT